MGLTEAKIKDLHDKKFDDLYEKHKKKWDDLAQNAHAIAKVHISGGNEPLPDDVLKFLMPMLEVDQQLRDHQETNKARYRRFREYFGDFLVEKIHNPVGGHG